MKKSLVVFMVVAAFVLSAASVMAEDNFFNGTSKWIASWKAPTCMMSEGAKAAPAAGMQAGSCSKMRTVDVLGNKLPAGTMRGGKL